MPKPFPKEAKEQYHFLVQQAEGYTGRIKLAPRSLMQWRNRALDWLKQNTPNSDLSSALAVAPVYNVQRGLSVLLRARPIVPFLRDAPAGILPPKPTNTKKVFIVHGHNDALKNAVARLLSRLGLEPIILHE